MKTPTKPKKAKQGKAATPQKRRGLLPRQERFCEFIAAGMTGVDAWLAAGYKVSRDVAKANAAESLTNPNVAARIAELRKPQQGETRKTKAEKLALLEKIMWDGTTRPSDLIAALRVHNDMTGDNAPQKLEVETGPNTLESIRERAAAVASALDLNARLRTRANRPAAVRAGLSRWNPEASA